VYDKWHEKGDIDPDELISGAREESVNKLICVGTTLDDSKQAIDFVKNREDCWASIGIHPHEATPALQNGHLDALKGLRAGAKVVAVGECGLDYFYTHSPREAQIEVLKAQIEVALEQNLPLIFHVREAFDDFWPIFESYPGLRGVLHSFTDSQANMERAIKHELYIGVNGIATFTKDQAQLAMYEAIPLNNLVLETDAPFLTPTPYRGTINEPKHVRRVAEFLSSLRAEPLEELAAATTRNAQKLFGI
jgi:TatD DNase family protein